MQFNFSKQQRLHHKQDFRTVFAQGKKANNRFLTAYYLQTACDRLPRLGIIIPKRTIHPAVRRVKMRRIIRESFRQSLKLKHLLGLDIIMVIRSQCDTNNHFFRTNVDQLWFTITQACLANERLSPS